MPDLSPPPTANADVADPPPANSLLAVFKSLTSVQLDPSHDSAFATILGAGSASPPKANAVVPDD